MSTVSILKKSCISAAEKERLKLRRMRILASATITPVTAVPILAPMIANTAVPSRISPLATSATINAVVNDELCTIMVTSTPASRATKGFSP